MPSDMRDLIDPRERAHFYYGISDDPPELLYRSDLDTNPFVVPKGRFSALPEKTVHGAFDATLTPIWRSTVAPAIVAMLVEKERGIRLSTLMAVRFSTPDEDGQAVFGPNVIWISVYPNTTTAVACRNASPDILRLLDEHGVKGAVVEWYEGAAQWLSGPPMMRIDTYSRLAVSYVRRAFTLALGIPLAAADRDDASEGALGLFFHEGVDELGRPSEKVYAVTAKHAVQNAETDYERGASGATRAHIRVCGTRRFQTVLDTTQALASRAANKAVRLANEIAGQTARPVANDEGEREGNAGALKRATHQAEDVVEHRARLETFLQDLQANWCDPLQRTVGWVHWAPRIHKDVDSRAYTLDIATVELDAAKWKDEFKGNVVYLGGRGLYGPVDITAMFSPDTTRPPSFKYPPDSLLDIEGCVPAARLAKPVAYAELGPATFLVAKDGPSTGLTRGRYSPAEACIVDASGAASWELAIYNCGRPAAEQAFAAPGDSGALVFNAQREMVALVHAGMRRDGAPHVVFATPAHFVVEQIRRRYPAADFARRVF